MGYSCDMIATVTHHDLLLILAIVLFFIAGGVFAWARDLPRTLLLVGLAVFAWSFLVTVG